MSSTRDFVSPGIFANDASTTIPPTPIAGVAYRDAAAGTDDVENGWRYGTRVDSKDWNQIMFLLTSLAQMADKQGLLGWSNLVDYAVPAMVFGSNGLPYIAIQASGPATTPQDPISAPLFWEQFASSGILTFTTLGVTNWTVPMAMQLGYIRPRVTVIGGGGGGARSTAAPGPSGGGGGGVAMSVVDLTGITSVSITVGAGGAGGATDPSVGVAGQSSLFGGIMSATGGGAGNNVGSSVLGGLGSGGALNQRVGTGQLAVLSASSAIMGGAGGGGESPYGIAGSPTPVNFGSGGAGRTGGAAISGAQGAVIIEW